MSDKTNHRTTFYKGAQIFGEGQPGDCAYIIESGRVEITALRDGKNVVIAEFGKGEVFGEMAILDDQERSATATAVENTELFVIQRDHLLDRMAAADPVVTLFMKVILEHFRATHRKLMGDDTSEYSLLPREALHPSGQPYRRDRERAIAAINLEQELSQALERDEFNVHYQPIIGIADNRVAGFEALVRWHHPERGIIAPNLFIPFAESTGLIIPLGIWIFEEACRTLPLLEDAVGAPIPGAPPLFMSINLSGRQISHANLIHEIKSALDKAGVDSGSIKVEITENVLLDDPESAIDVLSRIKDLGIELSLDDFGTGYSSLSYLHRFPIDNIKIDRSFVSTMTEGGDNREIVRAISGLAHDLRLEVIAEGIEMPEELSLLRSFQTDYGQGYLIAKPMMKDNTIEFLKSPKSW